MSRSWTTYIMDRLGGSRVSALWLLGAPFCQSDRIFARVTYHILMLQSLGGDLIFGAVAIGFRPRFQRKRISTCASACIFDDRFPLRRRRVQPVFSGRTFSR